MRLCTTEEMLDGATMGTGCSFDAAYSWVSDPCDLSLCEPDGSDCHDPTAPVTTEELDVDQRYVMIISGRCGDIPGRSDVSTWDECSTAILDSTFDDNRQLNANTPYKQNDPLHPFGCHLGAHGNPIFNEMEDSQADCSGWYQCICECDTDECVSDSSMELTSCPAAEEATNSKIVTGDESKIVTGTVLIRNCASKIISMTPPLCPPRRPL